MVIFFMVSSLFLGINNIASNVITGTISIKGNIQLSNEYSYKILPVSRNIQIRTMTDILSTIKSA